MYPNTYSPLRYLGGKRKLVDFILPLIPNDINHIVSPFLGGGAIELYLSNIDIRVYAYDNFHPLVNFWNHILKDPNPLIDGMKKWMPLRDRYYILRGEYWDMTDPLEQAIAFWALNKSSFSGKTLASTGVMGEGKDYEMPHFEKFRNFKSPLLSVECMDFRESLDRHPNSFAYIDPPYIGRERHYGDGTVKTFPHAELAEIVRDRKGSSLVSYNDCEEIRELYSGFTFLYPDWKYSAYTKGGQRDSTEILIVTE